PRGRIRGAVTRSLRQPEGIHRVARTGDQILNAVEHPRGRSVADGTQQPLVPQDLSRRGIVRNEVRAGAAREEQPSGRRQNPGADGPADVAVLVRPLHLARAHVDRLEHRLAPQAEAAAGAALPPWRPVTEVGAWG